MSKSKLSPTTLFFCCVSNFSPKINYFSVININKTRLKTILFGLKTGEMTKFRGETT